MFVQVDKEEKDTQERSMMPKDEVVGQDAWGSELVAPEATDWASEPVSSVPAVHAPSAKLPPSVPAESNKDDWSAPTPGNTNKWGGDEDAWD